MSMKVLGKHNFVFKSKDNDDESLSLQTIFMDNGNGIFACMNQELILTSNFRNERIVGINLFTPEKLRKLANALENYQNSFKEGKPIGSPPKCEASQHVWGPWKPGHLANGQRFQTHRCGVCGLNLSTTPKHWWQFWIIK